MVTGMDWQDGLAMAVACACAAWVLWSTLQPFVRKIAGACGMCAGCGTESSTGEQGDLLQIDPPDA
jgi:hypothetical protein